MDVRVTHDRYGRTTQHTNGVLSHRVSSSGSPQSDGVLNKAVRMKIRHYRQISQYTDRPDPIVFLSIASSTSGRFYEDFPRLIFLHAHREASILTGELHEESLSKWHMMCVMLKALPAYCASSSSVTFFP
jgi:hypothetical protein